MTDALAELRVIAEVADVRMRVEVAGRYVNTYTAAEYAARDLRDAHAFAYLDHPKVNTDQYGFNKATCEATGMAHMTWHRIRKLYAASKGGDPAVQAGRYLRRAERNLPKVRRAADPAFHLAEIRDQHSAQAAAHQIVTEGRKVRDDALRLLLPEVASNTALAELAGVDEHTIYLIRAAARNPKAKAETPARKGRPPKAKTAVK